MPLLVQASGGHYQYEDGLSGAPEAGIDVHPGAVSGMVTLNAYQYAELDSNPANPVGLDAASPATLFSAEAVDPMSSLLSAVTLELPFDNQMLSPQLYQLDSSGAGWVLQPSAQFDTVQGVASLDTMQMGTYEVFGIAVPEPDASLAVLLLFLFGLAARGASSELFPLRAILQRRLRCG
jgi:hypothetical protein